MLTFLSPAPSLGNGRRAVYRCDCGREVTARVSDVDAGKTTRCRVPGAHALPREEVLARHRAAMKRRRERVATGDEDVVPARPLPPPAWATEQIALVGRLIIALRPPFDELSWLPPTRIADVCELVECEEQHLASLMVARWLESDGQRVWGRRIAAGDVFGAPQMFHDTTTVSSHNDGSHAEAA